MSQVVLKKLVINNFGPIIKDCIEFVPFTYFIGRNNSGKSHYLKAIEILLASRSPSKSEIIALQHDRNQAIRLEGYFEGSQDFTSLISTSNHKQAVDEAIVDGIIKVVCILDPNNEEVNQFGITKPDGTIHNPSGFKGNLLKVLPESISITATADTIDELKNTQNTALSKIKREVLATFFEELKVKTKESLAKLDEYLHSVESGSRCPELVNFEKRFKEELMGEFEDVQPSVEFSLPDEEVIAKEMKIFLDDGYKSEIEQKGNGLQRAALLAMLKLLAKYGVRYKDRPSPIFLIGELESFLHPFAQKQFADVLQSLASLYQIVTTTHSPFIIKPKAIEGYRRITKTQLEGTHAVMPKLSSVDEGLVERHLENRGNLEGLFADKVVIVEGKHDENCYEKFRELFKIPFPDKKFLVFVKTDGKEQLRIARKFYGGMGFESVSILADLDYLFSRDIKHLYSELGINDSLSDDYRKHIEWVEDKDPSLEKVLELIGGKGFPKDHDKNLETLETKSVFVLKHGGPENYYKNNKGEKDGWAKLKSESDIEEPKYLKTLMEKVLS
ncbi:AAA family ATPase [Patescibacteria group bacterium]|nr:AAA family ATPase [Patescibacteria group bacterium]